MKQLVAYVSQIGTFMICAQVLIHFRPDGSYEKYLKFLVSIMILAQLLSPFLQLTGTYQDPEKRLQDMEGYRRQMEESTERIGQDAELVMEKMALLYWEQMQSTSESPIAGAQYEAGESTMADSEQRTPIAPVRIKPIE